MAAVKIRIADMIGKPYGLLTVLKRDGEGCGEDCNLICECECGNRKSVYKYSILSGDTVSCGCYRRTVTKANNTTHGQCRGFTETSEYTVWQSMRARCQNPNNHAYDRYGARGIQVCDRWESFEAFYADVGPRPSTKHSLDRFPNNDGNYEPGNVRWATEGQRMIATDLVRHLGVSFRVVRWRIQKYGSSLTAEHFVSTRTKQTPRI